jgi:site-specific DNA recombinase
MKTSAGRTAVRAAAYVRVSTEEQVDGHSLDAQRRAIVAACAERGWEIVEWYADEGVSAHTDDASRRPAFHRMVEDARARRFDAVVVHKLDRFARSVVVALSTFKLLSDRGISFLSLSEQGMDFTTPMGKVMFGMLALLAEYYSENLGLETKKGKAERKAKGLHNGLVPFGYRSVDGRAEPDPETAVGARLAFRLAAEGQSLMRIAQTLNGAGYRTAGNQRRGVFTRDTVRDMLANRFYLGELPVFEPGRARRVRDWQRGQHAPLIDEATFAAARTAVASRATAVHAARRNATVYSLSGLLRCAHCREKMRVVRTENGRVRYHCRSKAQGLGCSGKGSFLDVYEEQVLADLAGFTLPDDWRAWLLADAERRADEAGWRDGERRRLEARLARLRELYGWGDITREEYQSERDRLERELALSMKAEPQHDRLGAMVRYLASLPTAWRDATAEQRNRLVNLVYEEICVDGPAVAYVKPRPELEPLFQVRTGASQPVACCASHANVGSGDPDGIRTHDLQRDRLAC